MRRQNWNHRFLIVSLLWLGLPGCVLWIPGATTTVQSQPDVSPTFREVTSDGQPMETAFICIGPDKSDQIVARMPLAVIEESMLEESKEGVPPKMGMHSLSVMMVKQTHCKITTKPKTDGSSNTIHGGQDTSANQFAVNSNTIAGRIVSVDDNELVLDDVVVIEHSEAKAHSVPLGQRIPYASRLFKTSGVLVQPVSVPGKVSIPMSSLRVVESVSESEWPFVRESGFQRIGIDFDFNIAPTQVARGQ